VSRKKRQRGKKGSEHIRVEEDHHLKLRNYVRSPVLFRPPLRVRGQVGKGKRRNSPVFLPLFLFYNHCT
jgi:hypothetical protein